VGQSLDFSETARNVSTSLDMTKRLFRTLEVFHDQASHSAAMNMAIDEAMLESTTAPLIRFYHWQSPALSFGYFGRFADVASHRGERDLVRRWTGGGIVFHGNDLTYSLMIPANHVVFAESSAAIYQKVHSALVDALAETGQRGIVAGGGDPGSWPVSSVSAKTGIRDAGYGCFANPVRADVMMNGRKVAGAAQRRTRRGLLQQGSIQGVDLGNRLAARFAQALSTNGHEYDSDDHLLKRASELAQQKYATEIWMQKR
jgi:lipoate-protein ligase A